MREPVLLLPGDDGADVVVVFERPAPGALRRFRIALGPRAGPARVRCPPGAELKVEVDGDLVCLEYREG